MASEIETFVTEIREAAIKARRWEIVIPADDTGPEEVICTVNSEVATAEMAKRWKGFVRVVESKDAVVAKVIGELAAALAEYARHEVATDVADIRRRRQAGDSIRRIGHDVNLSGAYIHRLLSGTVKPPCRVATDALARVNAIIKEAKSHG